MPPNTVYVGRPSKWGNQVDWREYGREQAVSMYRESIFEGEVDEFFISEVMRELKGKNLACWCPLDQPCHADVLLKIANGGKMTKDEQVKDFIKAILVEFEQNYVGDLVDYDDFHNAIEIFLYDRLQNFATQLGELK
jgi:hypothetical protein